MTKMPLAEDEDIVNVLSPDRSNQPRREPVPKAIDCTCSP
jgi:hypothetical protein